MKYHLNESSQKRQKAILDALKTGVPLAGLLAVTALAGGGCGSSKPIVGIIAPVPAENSRATAQQPNRPNENPAPALLGKPGEIPANGVNEKKPEMPTTPGTPPPPEHQLELPKQTAVYRAVKGDTMWKIAQAHNTTLEVLLALNRMSREQAAKIIVGQEIVVPAEHGK